MNLGVILDVAIGLIFIFFVLSMIATGLQELIAGVFTWRGTYLTKGIDVIVSNDVNARFRWYGIRDWLKGYLTAQPGSSTADMKAKALAAEAKAKTAADEAAKAAGVAANATADKETKMAAADKAKEAADEAAKAAVELRKKAGPPVTDAEARILSVTAHPLLRGTPASLPSYVPANNFSLALLDVLRDGSDAPVFSQIERTVDALPAGDLKRILSTYLREAEGDLDEFRSRIETWFDDAMDRLSGIYKRLTQWVLLILGVSLAAGLNVDSIRVANTLWAQPEMRTTLAASATKLAANNAACSPPTGNDTIKGATTNDASVPAAASTAGTTTPSPNPSQPANVSEELKKTMGCVQLLESQNLPLGWKGDELATMSLRVWLLTALGWLITALAISLGAPFWFDLLGTFTNIRAAGPTPARSDDPSTTAPGS